MKLLWIGININDEIRDDLLRYKAKILSGSVSERNLIEGLDANGYLEMDSINSYRYPAYPVGPKVVERKNWSRNGKSFDVNIGYRNVRYLSHLSRERALKKEVRNWVKNVPESEEIVVLVYPMHSPFLAAAKELKKIRKNTKIALIVPDLPQYMDLHMSKVKKLLKAIDWHKIKKLLRCVDKYVLYSAHMAEFLKLKDRSWTVMEGSYDADLTVSENEVNRNSERTAVMYSGVLDMRYGIPELLEAFSSIKGDDYELWLTGAGNAVPLIKAMAQKDPRIKFYGFLPSRKDLLIKQKEATMLINVRKPTEAASAYCFPSKLFEYMASGNPVLSFDIPGIPDEYHKHLVIMRECSSECIAETVVKVAKMTDSERRDFGNSAMNFILENKNKITQTEKMIEFIKK